MEQRKIEIAVISDLHLATHACKAKQLLKYLKSISPKTLVLNGDIIDSWRFSRNYFPKSQLKVVRQIIKMLEKGIKVIYISGNHDEFLRRFNNIEIGKLSITDQLVLDIDGNRTWILHGDVFDHIIHRAKWLAKIGSAFYGLLTILNKTINASIKILGFNEVLLYKKFKTKILTQKEKPSRFEVSVCKTAINKKFDTVICGHTHYPTERLFTSIYGSVRYINCGDWVEHLSAAEFSDNQWRLYYFNNTDEETIDDFEILEPTNFYKQALNDLLSVNF